MQYTTIRLTKETINKIKEIGKKSETYDQIITKLIKKQGEHNGLL